MKTLFIALVSFSMTVFASDDKPGNYCHDKQVNANWDKMLFETPDDPVIINLYGLRVGLCRMIDKGQISLEQGVEIWNHEHARSVIQRSMDEAETRKEFIL